MTRMRHEFISSAPTQLEPATLYVSLQYRSVLHLCACGCGAEVVTPLAPDEWSVTFDGATISLAPSVGNDSLVCRSHYWIRQSEMHWCLPLTDDDVAALRAADPVAASEPMSVPAERAEAAKQRWWSRLWTRLRRP